MSDNMRKLAARAVALRERLLEQAEAEKAAAEEKEAFLPQALGHVGKGVGHLLQGGATGAGRLFMRGMKGGPIRQATTLGVAGTTAAGLNEGLDAAGLPHFGVGDGTKVWDPYQADMRKRVTGREGMLSSLANFARRPVQSTMAAFGMTAPSSDPQDYFNSQHGPAGLKNISIDPLTGQATFDYTGSGSAQISPYMRKWIQQNNEDARLRKMLGIDGGSSPGGGGGGYNGGGYNGGRGNHVFRFEDQPPGISLSSTY